MKKTILTLSLVAGSISLSHAVGIFAPGDPIVGGQIIAGNFEEGVIGLVTPNINNWPTNEPPSAAIDGFGQKYLNFGEENTGIVVTPGGGASIATSITLWTANDAEPRDPGSYSVYGTNSVLGAAPFVVADFTLISTGPLALPSTRNAGGAAEPLLAANSQTVAFANADAFTSYMVVFPTLKDAGAANSMQIAEIQLDGSFTIPEPGSSALLALGLGVVFFRRKR